MVKAEIESRHSTEPKLVHLDIPLTYTTGRRNSLCPVPVAEAEMQRRKLRLKHAEWMG